MRVLLVEDERHLADTIKRRLTDHGFVGVRYAVMGSLDAMAVQGVVMAGAEGISELPVLGRFMTGMAPR